MNAIVRFRVAVTMRFSLADFVRAATSNLRRFVRAYVVSSAPVPIGFLAGWVFCRGFARGLGIPTQELSYMTTGWVLPGLVEE
jgi:hypothetical protein